MPELRADDLPVRPVGPGRERLPQARRVLRRTRRRQRDRQRPRAADGPRRRDFTHAPGRAFGVSPEPGPSSRTTRVSRITRIARTLTAPKLRLAAFILYTVALCLGTHWPRLTIDIGDFHRPDLALHLTAFGGFTILLIASNLLGDWLRPRTVVRAFFVAAVFAAINESTQGIPALGRTVALDDYLANLLGIALATAAVLAITIPFGKQLTAALSPEPASATPPPSPAPAGEVPAQRAEGALLDPATTPTPSLAASVRTFGLITLVSRVLGLARDLVTVRIFGDTAVGSAFAAAFAIPNLFRRLFGEGALAAAFIPEYAALDKNDPRRAQAFASLTVAALALFTGALTVVIELALLAVLLIAGDDPDRALSLRLIMLLIPFMPMVCVAALLGGILQTHHRFAPSAAMPVLLNLCIIAAAIPFLVRTDPAPVTAAYAIGIAALVSGLLQIALALLALRRHVRWQRPDAPALAELRDPVRRTLRRFGPVVLGMGTVQLSALLDTLVAMYPVWVGPTVFGTDYPLDPESNAILFYAQRLYQFPLGVFGIAVATVVFPMLARSAADVRTGTGAFADTLRRGVRLSLFIGVPATVGLLLVAPDLVRVLFRAPEGSDLGFSAAGARRATLVLVCYGLAVWVYSLNQLWTRAFYAQGDTRTPLRVALWTLVANLLLNLILIWPLAEAGLALATALVAMGQTVALSVLLQRKAGWSPWSGGVFASGARTLACSALLAVAVLGVQRLVPWGEDTWATWALRLTGGVVVGLMTYALASAAFRQPELRQLVRK
ncbi:MAG: murein biosynthesis integral membrane protein MurJ [Phycisphaerales bacterium]|nr:MAG: murein biosynthesis integral membrane protein MurJ [Phycisphaerales bacterium]